MNEKRFGDKKFSMLISGQDSPGRVPGVGLVASLYEGEDRAFPGAVAWLSDYRGTDWPVVVVDFVMVPDHLRRHGLATCLLLMLDDHFGRCVVYTDAISNSGQRLIDKIAKIN